MILELRRLTLAWDCPATRPTAPEGFYPLTSAFLPPELLVCMFYKNLGFQLWAQHEA